MANDILFTTNNKILSFTPGDLLWNYITDILVLIGF